MSTPTLFEASVKSWMLWSLGWYAPLITFVGFCYQSNSNSNSNSTFIALNLYLMIDSKTQKAKIRDRNR